MRASPVMFHRFACRVTLFTRTNCSLCDDAKASLFRVWERRPFEYDEVDILQPGREKWKIYEFDTPVVHFDKTKEANTDFQTSVSHRLKLMHRMSEQQIEEHIDKAMLNSPS